MQESRITVKMIELDLIPCSIRWKHSISGLGRMYADIVKMLRENYGVEGVKRLNEVMYNIGFNQGNEILDFLGLKKTLEGCAYALIAGHRIYGMKSKIIYKEENKVIIQASHCYWGRKLKCWTPQTCVSIEHYDSGIIMAILPSVTHYTTKKHSLGHKGCEVVIEI